VKNTYAGRRPRQTIVEYLDELGETKIDFTFQRSVDLNSLLYKKLPIITVCGTNGKGSTTAFLENILIESGYRVGSCTSPHLEHVRERIRIQGEPVSEMLFETYGQSCRKKIESAKIQPTYFEFLTFLALDMFEQEKIDIAIFEAGLGGRLDSTNAIPRIGAILTSISMDHQSYLGDTLLKIVKEKLPILENAPFSIVSQQEPEVAEFIESTLKKTHLTEGKEFQHSGSSNMFLYEHGAFRLGPIQLGLVADHQSSNAACATAMAIYLFNQGWNINEDNIVKGLIRTRNPGRIEKWTSPEGREVWLDVAHNVDSMSKLVQYLYLRDVVEFHTIFGCSTDKPWAEMIESLQAITQTFHWVTTPTARSWAPSELKLEDPIQCLKKLTEQEHPKILVTGSFYHVGAIRKELPKLGYSVANATI
jgi:dihydrofolate synthase/folylpolyglutamate synthase